MTIASKAPEIDPGQPGYEEVKNYVKEKFSAFYTATAPNGNLSAVADIDSVAKLYLINALPEKITTSDKDDIEAARAAYEALTDDRKALVDEDVLKKLTDAEEALNSLVLLGDVDGDGDVTSIDATLIQRYLVGIRILSDKQIKAVDIDGDGVATILDATLIQRCLAGITVKYPINEYV